jgi:hypothetical protein
MAEAFRSGAAKSRVVELLPDAGQYIFRTNEADVLREIRIALPALN